MLMPGGGPKCTVCARAAWAPEHTNASPTHHSVTVRGLANRGNRALMSRSRYCLMSDVVARVLGLVLYRSNQLWRYSCVRK